MANKNETIDNAKLVEELRETIVKLNKRITELETMVNNKPKHSVRLKGYYMNHPPDSIIIVSDDEYNNMRHAGIIY